MKLFRMFGDNVFLLGMFIVLIFATQARAGGGFAAASAQAQMLCVGVANTITGDTDDTCDNLIMTETGAFTCPSARACAQILREVICEDLDGCSDTTPGKVVEEAPEKQLEGAP